MRIYIAGPMSGLPDFNYPMFQKAVDVLKEAYPDWEIISPHDLDETWGSVEKGWTWREYMQRDLKILVHCDAIALLPGFMTSKGARLEHHVARELGLEIWFMISDGESLHPTLIHNGNPVANLVPDTNVSIHECDRDWASIP